MWTSVRPWLTAAADALDDAAVAVETEGCNCGGGGGFAGAAAPLRDAGEALAGAAAAAGPRRPT